MRISISAGLPAAETGALGIDDGAFVPQQDLSYREPAGGWP